MLSESAQLDLLVFDVAGTTIRHVVATLHSLDLAAGCSIIVGVTHGTRSYRELAAHLHTHIKSDLHDVQSVLLGSSATNSPAGVRRAPSRWGRFPC
jgi:hypothetical protein